MYGSFLHVRPPDWRFHFDGKHVIGRARDCNLRERQMLLAHDVGGVEKEGNHEGSPMSFFSFFDTVRAENPPVSLSHKH